jgi:hypothetical protein
MEMVPFDNTLPPQGAQCNLPPKAGCVERTLRDTMATGQEAEIFQVRISPAAA